MLLGVVILLVYALALKELMMIWITLYIVGINVHAEILCLATKKAIL